MLRFVVVLSVVPSRALSSGPCPAVPRPSQNSAPPQHQHSSNYFTLIFVVSKFSFKIFYSLSFKLQHPDPIHQSAPLAMTFWF